MSRLRFQNTKQKHQLSVKSNCCYLSAAVIESISMTTKQLDVIILAGGLRLSPLRSELKVHELCLPITQSKSLLAAWLEVINELKQCRMVVIAVSNQSDAAQIQQTLDGLKGLNSNLPQTQVIVEPRRWRGTAGVLRDVAQEYAKSEILLAVEGACLPPSSLASFVAACNSEKTGAVGITHKSDPVGVYVFHRSVMKHVPTVGFFDVKEQLLPQMYAKKIGAHAVQISNNFIRLRDRQTYLSAMSEYALQQDNSDSCVNGKVPQSNKNYQLVDTCVIEPTAFVGDGSVLRRSIVFTGAKIGVNTVINECIIGSGVVVPNGLIVSQTIVTQENISSIMSREKSRAHRTKLRKRAIRN